MAYEERPIQIFAGSASIEFVNNMCKHLKIDPGQSHVITFREGNTFVKIREKVRGKDIYIVQSIAVHPNDEFMELLFWIDAFKRASAKSVTAIIPYFSYAKGDKKDEPRVSIRARVCADCLEITGIDRLLTMDLHSPQIQGFFKKPVDHLSAIPLLSRYIKEKELDNLVIVSPDAGFAKNARQYASFLNSPVAIGDKLRRANDEKAEVLEIIGDIKGRNAILVDDFTITCNTLVSAAFKLKSQGAERIFACVSHALLDEQGIATLENSPIEQLVTTDTVENSKVMNHPKIKIITATQIFAEAVRAIHNEDSLGELLDHYRSPAWDPRQSD